jgi:hypothetical protein
VDPFQPEAPKTSGAEASAPLAGVLAELAKLGAALDGQRKPITNSVSLKFSAREFVDALFDSIYLPIPKSGNTKKGILGETCPITGLKKAALYELFELRDGVGLPVIQVVSMKEEGEAHGTRLYSPGSVLRYASGRAPHTVGHVMLAETVGKRDRVCSTPLDKRMRPIY